MQSRYNLHLLLFVLVIGLIQCKKDESKQKDKNTNYTKYVDPFMGTADHGHVYPGATVPFGMVQLSPDNGTAGWDWCSGYNWADSIIIGFSHTHLSGTGIGDLLDISMMPTNADVDLTKKSEARSSAYAATFSHDNEEASPGYYTVSLDNGIKVELTAGERYGFHHYTFPKEKAAKIYLDLGWALNWDKAVKTQINVVSDTKITGHRYSTGWAEDQRVFFAAEFSEPITKYSLADSTKIRDGKNVDGELLRALFDFGNAENIKMKVAISTADIVGAEKALAESGGWDFFVHRDDAEELWEKELKKIEVKSDDEALMRTFYTALYRTCLAPTVLEDANGKYKGADNKVHQASDFKRYGLFSLWDTFRAANPLYTITQPDKINDFINSMLAHYDEYGLLPVWDLLANETNTMTGYHAVPVIVDAYLKGYRNYDVEKAYQAIKKSSMQNIRATDLYRKYNYIPHDLAGQSVTRTLEYAFDDWCIAQMALSMGKSEDNKEYMRRSESYKNLFNPETGFMRAKLADGSWKTPFDPQYSSHDFDVAEYTEGNAWQHSWFVPHAVEELISMHGGDEKFRKMLDGLFTADSEIKGDFISSDISGLIGQYAHGNEPSHHIAYMYNYADRFDKTQDRIREIVTTQYNDTPHGLCGNEDCGQMSAWYVFSTIGMYPMNPASGRYDLGLSFFDEVTLNLDGDKTFTITTDNAGENSKTVKLNGKIIENKWITHDQLMAGGSLQFLK